VGLARCGSVFPVSVVVGVAGGGVPLGGCACAVLAWGGASRGYTDHHCPRQRTLRLRDHTHRLGLPMVVCVECLPADKPWDVVSRVKGALQLLINRYG